MSQIPPVLQVVPTVSQKNRNVDHGPSSSNLVGGRSLLLLLEPALLDGGGLASGSLALDLDFLGLVGLELVGQVGLLGRLGRSGQLELLDVSVGVTGLDGGRLVGAEFTEVQLLNGVGYIKSY